MAEIEVGNLVARISLDGTGLDKSMAQIQREMKLVASEFEKASASLEAFGSEEDKLRAKSDHLTKQIALQGQRVELLRQEFKKAAQEKGEDAVATQKLAVQLNKAEAALAKMKVELQKTNKELADQPSRMAKWSSGLQDIGNRLQSAGQEIATSFGVAGAAITAALGFAVNTAADFEAQMSRVGAIAGASKEQLKAMSDTAMELGATTSKSASEVAQGMEMMAAMGFEVNEIIAAMPGVIAAAEASGEDMALVADTVAAALNAFGLEAKEASRVADVLAQSANSSAASVGDLSYTFKYAAPVAKALGISLEELAAATGIMADSGIRGEQAGTTLRAALLRLADPPREAANTLRDLGVTITDAQGNMLPFEKIIAQLKNSLQGMGDAQKAAALSTIFGTEAVTGMLSVIEAGPEKLKALTTELQNSAGASAEAAAKMKDNLKGSLEELSGAFETAQIAIGNALIPIIQSLAGALQSVVDWFNQLDPSIQQFIALSAAAGAALLTLVGAFGAIMAAVGLAASGFGALGLSLSAVSAAILPVTAAIAGLTAAGILLYQNWDTIKTYAIQVWDSIKGYVLPVVDEVAGFIRDTFEDLAEWWRQIWPDLKQAFANIWDGILAVVTPIINAIVALMQWAWPFVKEIIIGTWENIKGVISGALDIIMGVINSFAALFTGNWSMLWENIKQILSGALKLIWNAVQLWGVGKLLKVFAKIGDDIIQVFVKLGKGVWDVLSGLLEKVVTWASNFAKPFLDLATKSFQWGKNIVEGLWNGISSMAEWVKNKVYEWVSAIGNTIKEFFGIASPSRLMAEYGRYIVEGLWEGIKSMASWIKSNVTQFASNISNTIKEFFGIHSPSRLMAEYGQYIAEGLAIGIEQNKGKPIQQADLMVQAINGALGKLQNELKLTAQIAQAEFDLMAAKMQESGSESEMLKAKYELLTQQLDIQNQTVAVLRKAYEDMKATKGENAEETKKLYLELLKEQAAYEGIRKQLEELESSYQSAAKAAQQLVYEQGRIFENINGKWVQVGGKGYADSGEPYNPPGIPDWLDTSNNGGGGGEKKDSGRTRPKDTDREGAYQKDVDKDNFAGSVNTNVRKAAKDIGDSIKEAFDKVKDAFRFPGLATGGTVTKSGWTWVGENGPELLRLPRAAEVTPPELIGPRYGVSGGIDYNRLARSMAAVLPTGPIYVTIPAKDLSEMRTITDFFNRIQQVARARG
jgi:TP901 family phage tail tape measure protein